MSNVISSIASYLSRDVESLDVISQNVANMRTAGYRTERLKGDFRTATGADDRALSLLDGNLDKTGAPLDLAIQGAGFFVVDQNGQERLTRNGQFHIDADHQLVDAMGRPVLGEAGPITLDSASVHIGVDGAIKDGDKEIDTLRIVGIANADGLREIGDGLYAYDGATGDWNGTLHQGALERSNVDPGTEMVRLMEVTRHAQSVQRAIQAYDAAMQSGISHLGDNA
ncbi:MULTISPECIES: flagellar hook basal-body protein [unclassified Dyella]|uniref:flagellar hook-basal body protein n=1 Tax=unclassified Dyella TaxID=2634549 RepID=UPI000C845304|nr:MULTISPECIES: flagellar hook basal-body protein [unclassified Dyella]MDR3443749.1 flagellar hook basal-body protein [Dyella sp.]PMQ04544.1 Flagellar basal-body rod protein FlgG [Dyella sp. AD56]